MRVLKIYNVNIFAAARNTEDLQSSFANTWRDHEPSPEAGEAPRHQHCCAPIFARSKPRFRFTAILLSPIDVLRSAGYLSSAAQTPAHARYAGAKCR
jgi:hypothetical protein